MLWQNKINSLYGGFLTRPTKMDFMKKFILWFALFGVSIFLAACSSEPETPPTATPMIVLNPVIPPTPTPEYTCAAVSTLPTAMPEELAVLPPITEADYVIGPADAGVTLVEYCDFQSDGCLAMAQINSELMSNYQGNLRIVFRPLPLSDVLDKSEESVLAAFAAGEQDKFWEMYDLLFVRHSEWVNLSPGQFKSWLAKEAPSAGIDAEQLAEAMKAEGALNRLKSAKETITDLSIPAVPVVFVNGSLQQSYVLDYQSLHDTIGLILLGQRQFTQCPPFTVDPAKEYTATLETEKGNIVIKLFPREAPLAVNSFIFLARQGWYDGVTFHRVIPGFVAQAGDPSGTGMGNPGYLFNNEISDYTFSIPGRVGMANSGPDTNGSQFFITYAPITYLDGVYTIFGQVASGLDVAEQLTPRDPSQGGYLPAGDKILRVTIEEK